MKDYAKEHVERQDMDLVRSFVHTNKNAFNDYKITSSIDKVLMKKKFKPKELTGLERQ